MQSTSTSGASSMHGIEIMGQYGSYDCYNSCSLTNQDLDWEEINLTQIKRPLQYGFICCCIKMANTKKSRE